MQFNILTFTTVALAGSAAALPKLPAVSWNQTTHAVTSLHAANLTTSRTAQKSNTMGSQAGSSDNDICTTLCSLQAQICSMALPTHDDYCWGTYLDCSRMCDPSLIR